MSEEKKDGYEVGIPLDELPPLESSVDPGDLAAEDDKDAAPTKAESDVSGEASGLPDLFGPEELAEVGLTAEMTESLEIEEKDDSLLPPVRENAEEDENLAEMAPREEDNAGADDLTPESLAGERSDAGREAERLIPAEQTSGDAADEDAAETHALASMNEEEGVDDAPPTASDAHRADADMAPSDEGGFIHHALLVDRLDTLSGQIGELQREFEGKLKYDAHKDEIIDRLHSELQEYKQDIIKKYVLAIVMDVVKVADDIRKWLAYFRSLEVSQRDPRKLFRYLEAIPSDLEDVFYWHGVKPFSHQEGAFDPARQRAIKKVPTDDPALDKSIAHSIRPGYEWETKVIRQEMVAVYVYQEKQESLDTGMIDE